MTKPCLTSAALARGASALSGSVMRYDSDRVCCKTLLLVVVAMATFAGSVVLLSRKSETVSQIGLYIDSATSQIIKPIYSERLLTTQHGNSGPYANHLIVNSNVVYDFDMRSYIARAQAGDCGLGEGCWAVNIPGYIVIESTPIDGQFNCLVSNKYSNDYISITRYQSTRSPAPCWFLTRQDLNYSQLVIATSYGDNVPLITSVTNLSNSRSNELSGGYHIYNSQGRFPSYSMLFYNTTEMQTVVDTMNSLWNSTLALTPSVNRIVLYKTWFEVLSLSFSFTGFAFSVMHFVVNLVDKTHASPSFDAPATFTRPDGRTSPLADPVTDLHRAMIPDAAQGVQTADPYQQLIDQS